VHSRKTLPKIHGRGKEYDKIIWTQIKNGGSDLISSHGNKIYCLKLINQSTSHLAYADKKGSHKLRKDAIKTIRLAIRSNNSARFRISNEEN
jgi:hypothetical protein